MANMQPEFSPDLFLLHWSLAPLGKPWLGFIKWHSNHASLGLKTQAARITPYTNVCHPLPTIATTVHPLHSD